MIVTNPINEYFSKKKKKEKNRINTLFVSINVYKFAMLRFKQFLRKIIKIYL